jgi:peptidoglycan/xylan/chitin deacetylase (PgdA/CDA1 family)
MAGERGVRRSHIPVALAAALACIGPAAADDCLNPDALGTARTLAVDPAIFERVGTMQYRGTIPLRPKEIVLTFDDGPMLPMTASVLRSLREECVHATFFVVGRQARAHPAVVRQIAGEGHAVANHSESHHLVALHGAHGVQEFDKGFASIRAALEPAGVEPAPFFRFPGLLNTHAVEAHAKAKKVSVMSADLLADDWTGIRAEHIIARGLARLGEKGSGIFLLHDVQPALALALPKLLRELKARGYRVVHIVPAPGAGAPPPPPAEPLVAEKKAAPPPARRVAARPAAKEPEPAELLPLARWRKMFGQQNQRTVTAVAYPGNENGGH